jgi:Glycosyl hydrolase catalytic core
MFTTTIHLPMIYATPQPVPTTALPYKGLAWADTRYPEDLAALNVSWFYVWGPSGPDIPGVERVPMLWGGNISTAIQPDYAGDLLVLNEPNLPNQANVSPTAAAAKMPQFGRGIPMPA